MHVNAAGEIKEFLHPIALESEREDVIKFIIVCVESGYNEAFVKTELSNAYKFNRTCEKDIFEDVVLFAYRTLKEYKEQLNARKNEKDILSYNSPSAITK